MCEKEENDKNSNTTSNPDQPSAFKAAYCVCIVVGELTNDDRPIQLTAPFCVVYFSIVWFVWPIVWDKIYYLHSVLSGVDINLVFIWQYFFISLKIYVELWGFYRLFNFLLVNFACVLRCCQCFFLLTCSDWRLIIFVTVVFAILPHFEIKLIKIFSIMLSIDVQQ